MKRLLVCLIVLLGMVPVIAAPLCGGPSLANGVVECKSPPMAFEVRLGPGAYPVLFVSDVFRGSNAEAAGLRPGDVILAVNGQFMRHFGTAGAFAARIREHALHSRALIEVQAALPGESGNGRSLQLLLSSPDERLGFAYHQAFYIATVRQGSLADRLGLRAGDFIQRIGAQNLAANLISVMHFDTVFEQWLAEPSGSLTVHRLRTAEAGGVTTWNAREITPDGQGPLDGPNPPPGVVREPELIKK